VINALFWHLSSGNCENVNTLPTAAWQTGFYADCCSLYYIRMGKTFLVLLSYAALERAKS
jgi:hypothetical protein